MRSGTPEQAATLSAAVSRGAGTQLWEPPACQPWPRRVPPACTVAAGRGHATPTQSRCQRPRKQGAGHRWSDAVPRPEPWPRVTVPARPPEPVHRVLTVQMRPHPARPLLWAEAQPARGAGRAGGRAAARPEQRDRWPSPRGSGLKADTADALSAKFFNQMGHEWEHRVAWGRDLPSALQRQRTVIPHRPVPGKAVALCAPGPRAPGPSVGVAPGPSAMNGLGSALLLRFPPNVWESVISPESSVWAAFSAAERGTEAPWGTHAEGHRSSPASESWRAGGGPERSGSSPPTQAEEVGGQRWDKTASLCKKPRGP